MINAAVCKVVLTMCITKVFALLVSSLIIIRITIIIKIKTYIQMYTHNSYNLESVKSKQ